MGSTRFSFLKIYILLIIFMTPSIGQGMDMNIEKEFLNTGEIENWAKGFYFGGYNQKVFSRGDNQYIVILGMPTSGMLTTQAVVFEKNLNKKYSVLIMTKVFYGNITVKEDERGLVFSAKKEILVIRLEKPAEPKGSSEPTK